MESLSGTADFPRSHSRTSDPTYKSIKEVNSYLKEIQMCSGQNKYISMLPAKQFLEIFSPKAKHLRSAMNTIPIYIAHS